MPLVAAAVLGQPRTANAAGPDPDEAPTWYGWQLMIADGLDGLLLAASLGSVAGTDNDAHVAFGVLAVGGYLVPSPVVHGLRGNVGRAVAGGLLRLLAPALGAGIGVFMPSEPAGPGEHPGFPFQGALVGGLAGMGLAAFVDDMLLAWGRPAPPEPPPVGVRWAPTISLARDTGQRDVPTLGVVGSF